MLWTHYKYDYSIDCKQMAKRRRRSAKLPTKPSMLYVSIDSSNVYSTSSDSSSSEYSPVKRPRPQKELKEFVACATPSSSDYAAQSNCDHDYECEDTNDPVVLLEKLLTMVQPKRRKDTSVRAVVRALKTHLEAQQTK